MHYYSFADGPAWSSIVNFISRLNVPNSNAASRYFSLTRTLFTALSPIKSGPDTNVKAKPLSRCAYSHHHPSPTTATIAELNDARQTVACLTYGGERWGGKKQEKGGRRNVFPLVSPFPPTFRIMVRLRFHLVSASCTGRVPTNIDKFTGVPHKCARPPRTARINFEELNARAKTHATRAKIQIFPQILVHPSRSSILREWERRVRHMPVLYANTPMHRSFEVKDQHSTLIRDYLRLLIEIDMEASK